MFTRISALLIMMALSACSKSSEVADMYSNAGFSTGWGNVGLGCNDAYCLASR